jgi:hypothetical protein
MHIIRYKIGKAKSAGVILPKESISLVKSPNRKILPAAKIVNTNAIPNQNFSFI